MEKVIRDNKVAVIYAPGFGAGWATWNPEFVDILVFHPLLVEMIESGKNSLITEEWLVSQFGEKFADVYCGANTQLQIKWLPVGTKFLIEEYDGNESIITMEDLRFISA
jgi:hypothetical protein